VLRLQQIMFLGNQSGARVSETGTGLCCRCKEYRPRCLPAGDGPLAGELWTAAGAPYLLEIADCLSGSTDMAQPISRRNSASGVP
jgi:hypothetical protein